MKSLSGKQILILVLVAVLIAGGVFFIAYFDVKKEPVVENDVEEEIPFSTHEVIGQSVEGRDIEVYTYGNGATHLLFVGGIHGGYEWNSVLLAYRFIDYLENNQEVVPDGLRLSVIPSANPDGVYKVIGEEGRFSMEDALEAEDPASGRFNAHEVDLNRNFACKWKPSSYWRGREVSAGTEPFSEPEAVAIRDYVLDNEVDAGIFWHSQANNVYASECENGVLSETIDIMNAYAKASGYGAVETFDAYEVTGDAEGWMASVGLPAITVELSTHEDVEWGRNLDGIEALFEYYGK
ncbi:MAG TPA: M14 family zinc carboxypeptidase [Candidatus Paceibacterota bacterium]|nr:M14 family zinc carboxypeptidase [Candidatus Paceibacterota bacterium]